MKLSLMMTTLLVAAGVAAAETKVTFDASPDLPKGWQTGITGKGQAKWEVVADDSARSKPHDLKQSGEATFTWAAFAGTDDNALVDGDFAMTEGELQPALKSLRAQGAKVANAEGKSIGVVVDGKTGEASK
jgi:hypothetical protein